MAVQFKVEVAFGSLPFGSLSWTDISHFVTKVSTSRGRQHELSRFEAGSCSLDLHDFGTGCFDPLNTASPFYPNITIGTPIRVTAIGPTWTEPVFVGYVNTWQPSIFPNSQQVGCEAADLARMIGRGNMNSPIYANFVSAELPSSGGQIAAWYRCDDASGSTATDSSGNGADGTYGGTPSFQQASALTFDPNPSIGTSSGRLIVDTTAQQASLSCAGWFRTTDMSYQVIVDRRPPGDPDPTISLIVFGGALVLNVQGTTSTVIGSGLADGQWHMVGVGNLSGSGYVYCDGVSYGPFPVFHRQTGDHTTIGAEVGAGGNNLQGEVDEWMVMLSDLNPIDMTGIPNYYTLGQPLRSSLTTGQTIGVVLSSGVGWTGATSLATGHVTLPPVSATLSGQSALSYIQTVENTEGPNLAASSSNRAAFFIARDGTPTYVVGDRSTSGSAYKGTFGPSGIPWRPGAQWRLDDLNLYQQVTGSRPDNPTYSASVPGAAILDYGLPATYGLDDLLYSSNSLVRQRLAWELGWLSVPRVRLPSLAVQSSVLSDANARKMAALELANFCTVQDPQGRYSVAVAEVERVEHNVDMTSGEWTTNLVISPANTV